MGDIRNTYDEWDQLVCPISGWPVFPRRGHSRGEKTRVRQHFCVKAPAEACTWPEEVHWDPEIGTIRNGVNRVGGESWEHLEAKALVASLLEKMAPEGTVIFEKRIQVSKDRYRIADVAIELPCGLTEVHEVQLAGITQQEMERRTDDYAAAGCPAHWWLGKDTADRYQLRDYLRNLEGGFQLLEFTENIPQDAQHLVEEETPIF